MLDGLKSKDITVWAVVVDNVVVDRHFGPPETYRHPLENEIEISLVEWDTQFRGHAQIGDIWDGHKFRRDIKR
jgi:hypothetical protein